MDNYIIIICPHCNVEILVYENEIKCAIFRHGIYKDTYKQINPHLSRELCEKLINDNLIIGCGKPFQLIKKNNTWKAEICDYK